MENKPKTQLAKFQEENKAMLPSILEFTKQGKKQREIADILGYPIHRIRAVYDRHNLNLNNNKEQQQSAPKAIKNKPTIIVGKDKFVPPRGVDKSEVVKAYDKWRAGLTKKDK